VTPAVTIAATGERPEPLELYRDDGPLARALGAAAGSAIALPPFVLLVAGAVPLFTSIAIEGGDAPRGAVAAAIAWLIACGGVSSGRRGADALRWTAPPLLRLVEYAAIIWIAAVAGQSSLPAAFALLAAVAFRHYDLVYRLRYQGDSPPRWVGDFGGGWDGRLLLACLLLIAGALPAGFWVVAAALGAVFVGESVTGWTRLRRAEPPVAYEDEEEEGH
jgi:hypothetical protein